MHEASRASVATLRSDSVHAQIVDFEDGDALALEDVEVATRFFGRFGLTPAAIQKLHVVDVHRLLETI